MHIRSFAFIAILAAVSLSFAAGASRADTAPPRGFFTLTGAAAEAYTPPSDLRRTRSISLEGRTIERYQQYAGAALVLGGQVAVMHDAAGAQMTVIGSYYPGLTSTSSHRIDARAAADAVNQLTGPATDRRVDLMVDPADGRLFFRVETRRFDERWFHWIDAGNGKVIRAYNGIESGTGTGVKGDTKDLASLTTFHSSSGHGATGAHYDLQAQDGRQLTLDAANRQAQLYYVTDSNDVWDLATDDRGSPGQPALVDAQYYANVADDFYQAEVGFDWLACTGLSAIQSVAHYKRNYDNAFWSGAYLIYGDGDGTTSREYSGALDVVAHESAHAVTDCTSALIYADESGALNESFSDVVGASAEFFADDAGLDPAATPDWFVGEEIELTPDTAPGFRNMANPGEDGDPDHYTERQVGGGDSGGVHTNSGISNHAFYLLVNGGQNAGCPAHPHCVGEGAVSVAGIGLAPALNIFFTGFASLPENATMCQARAATVAVAGPHGASVTDAWRAVGLTDAVCLGTPSTPTATATPTQTATSTSVPTLTPTATATATTTPTTSATPTPVPVDTDGDGCSDARELGPNEVLGGDRDPNDFWDFFDVTEDSVIDLEDVVLILGHFGHAHDADALDPSLDRSSPDAAKPWRTSAALPGTEGIDVGDVIVNLQSFGHRCV